MAIPMTLRIPVFKRRRSLSKTKTETPEPAFESKKNPDCCTGTVEDVLVQKNQKPRTHHAVQRSILN